MNDNLEDYCRRLKNHLDKDVLVKVTKPPIYIKNLLISNPTDNIILVYKEEKPIENTLIIKKEESVEIGNSVADLSITGQPLECPFDKEDETLNVTISAEPAAVPEETYHAPLTLLEARKCLSLVYLKMKPALPVWVLTEMMDKDKTFLLGAEIKNNWRVRYWAKGYPNQTDKVAIKDMLEDFEKTCKIGPGYKVSSEVQCVFNLQGQPGMTQNAKCFLESTWQRPSYEVPVSQAETHLILECSVGHEDSQISRWWEQLNLLHDYLEVIKQSRQVQLTYQRDVIKLPSYKTPGNSEKPPLKSRVMDLLQCSDSTSVCRQLESLQNVTSALNSTIHELLDKQKGQDFTDRLWVLLTEAETYNELSECFQLVIREVRKHSIKPYIFAKNRTRMASLLRNLKLSGSNVELMLEPLELMVEMGIEKLKRDYMFMFLASQIATEDSLSIPKLPSFGDLMGTEWQVTVDTWLAWLARLHTVLELVSVIHMAMNMPILVQVTGLALTTFLRPDSPVQSLLHLINNRTYGLRVPVVSQEVKSYIEGDRLFYRWILKLSATVHKRKVTSTYVLLEESPFPQKLLTQMIDNETLDKTEVLTKTMLGTSLDSSKIQENYCYLQLSSAAEDLPN